MKFYSAAFAANLALVAAGWLLFHTASAGVQNGVVWGLVLAAAVLEMCAFSLRRESLEQ